MLQAEKISKYYSEKLVLKEISVQCNPSEVTILLGANGVGKSTFLRVLAGLVTPDSGTVTKIGSVSYMGHLSELYSRLTVSENLKLFSDVSGTPCDYRNALETWGLSKFSHYRVHELSKGNEFRVGLARAFMGAPEYLFLDEPSSALDDKGVGILRSEILRLKSLKTTVLLATHDIERLHEIASRIVVLEAGQITKDSRDSSIPDTIAYYRGVNR